MKKQKKKIIWKAGAPEGRHLKAHFISDEYAENRTRIFKRVFKVPEKHNIKLSPELKIKFENLIKHFYHDYTKIKKPLSSSELRTLFENLKNSAEKFVASLEDIRHSDIKRNVPLPPEKITDPAIKKLIKDAKQWEAAAMKRLIELPKPKQGPKEPPFLKAFILNLAEIYEQASGKKAEPGWYDDKYRKEIHGEFALFVKKVLDKIDKSLYYDGRSLVNYLKKVFS